MKQGAAGAVVATLALVLSLLVVSPATAASQVVGAAASTTGSNVEAATGPLADTGIVKTAVVGFNPENIISDALFYDGNAMSSAEIQSFLDSKIGRCENGKCLNVLSASISSRDAWYSQVTGDLVCSALQGGTMRVSELIYRVQVACGISAKAILVTLQKEQGLTTSSAPSDWNLRAAMGASCPDTEPCDPAYSGVGPQIVQGVRQLKIYKAGRFGKQPGVNFIGYNPSASCGGTNLNIQNYATAALYNYTPYQPNAASLAAGWGLGDGCSSYGNRNFFNYYTSWFGSPQRDPGAEIQNEYLWQGGAATLGAPVSGVIRIESNGGGYARAFVNGSVYWTIAYGAKTIRAGSIRDYYWARGGADGSMGWPASIEAPISGPSGSGAGQAFTGGSLYVSRFGTYLVTGDVRARYFDSGGASGVVGWPTADVKCIQGVCQQEFSEATIVATPAGAALVREPVRAVFAAAGGASGAWGVPMMDAASIAGTSDGFGQAFTGGSVYYRSGGVARFVSGAVRDQYFSLGGASGSLGFPVGDQVCAAGGASCQQQFERGWILWTAASGARVGDPSIDAAYAAAGGAGGVLGARTGTFVSYSYNGGGVAEVFAGGAIFFKSSAGAHAVSGGIRATYFAAGGAAGAYGWPTSDQTCTASLCQQTFEGGIVFLAAGQVLSVREPVSAVFAAAGGASGAWGVPMMDAASIAGTSDGFGQAFTGGSVYYRSGGVARFVSGAVRDQYFSLGGASGSLGFPVGDQVCAAGGASCQQQFERGWILWTAASGARVGDPSIDAAYAAAGGAGGVLGARTGTFVSYSYNGGGVAEVFAGGAIFFKSSAGAHAVSGGIRATYFAAGGAAGAYGWPTSDQTCTASLCQQTFEGGTISVTTR